MRQHDFRRLLPIFCLPILISTGALAEPLVPTDKHTVSSFRNDTFTRQRQVNNEVAAKKR